MGLFHEPKKTEKADLDKHRFLFFNLSLVITLLLVILAFEWRMSDSEEEKIIVRENTIVDEIVDVPPTEIPPPPPPVLQQARLVEIPDQEEIEEEINIQLDIDMTNTTVAQEFTIPEAPKVEIEEEESDKIFLVVEQSASPVGGMSAFYKYVSENIKYPSQARRMTIEGKVFIEFVVEKDGSITAVNVVKGIGAGCDEEAVRIVQNSPKWLPGKQRGRPVKQRMVLPIHFKLANRA